MTGAVNDWTKPSQHGEPGLSSVAPIAQSSRDRSIRGRHPEVFQHAGVFCGELVSATSPVDSSQRECLLLDIAYGW
jgi:hypothetical protein